MNSEVDLYTRLFSESIEKEMENSTQELRGLITLISPQLSMNNFSTNPEHYIIKTLNRFIIGYPYKYGEITIYNSTVTPLLTINAEKVFGGKIQPNISFTNQKQVGNQLTNIIFKKKSEEIIQFKPEPPGTGSSILIFFPIQSDKLYFLSAYVQLNYLIDQVSEKLKFPILCFYKINCSINWRSCIIFSLCTRNEI